MGSEDGYFKQGNPGGPGRLKIQCSYDELIAAEELTSKAHPKNPNRHSPDQLQRLGKILEYQGIRRPVRISKLSGYITAGHGLVLAVSALGKSTKVPVNFQDYESEEQEYADVVADNSIASWAELDLSAINLELPNLGPDFDLDWLGLKDFELEPADKYGDKDADLVPKVHATDIKRGDLYELGGHRLLCGDATDSKDVERLMNGEKADMVYTDPPYNIASDSKNYAAEVSDAMKTLKNAEWDKDFDIIPALDRIKESVKKDATIYVWTSHFLIQKIWDHLNDWCDFTNYCVWNKPNPMPSLSKRHWTWNTELCAYGTVGSKRVVNFPNEGHALSTWTFTKHSDGTHPTQKPIELIEHGITFNSNSNSLILDPFLGSGSTLIACEKTNRKCFGMEIDPRYIDVIIRRWESFSGGKAEIFLPDGSTRIWSEVEQERRQSKA